MWRLRAPLLALLLMQVILLASSGVTATKKPLGKQETCNMKNHMIEYLRNNGVQIYERPQNNTVDCPKEWGVYGTCCNPSDMKEQLNHKLFLNKAALQSVSKEITDLGKRIKSFWRSNSKRFRLTTLFKQRRIGNGVTFVTAVPSKVSQSIHLRIHQLGKIGKAIIKNTPELVLFQQKCVAKINSVISKSACSICSGRSDDFFNENYKLHVSEPLCRDILSECSDAWVSMVHLVAQAKEYMTLVRRMTKFSKSDKYLEEAAFTMNLDSFITNRNLIPILKLCRVKKNKHLQTCPFQHVAALCEQFIHIQAPTYIESSQSQINSLLSQLRLIDQMIEDTHLQIELASVEIMESPKSTIFDSRYSMLIRRAEQGLKLSSLILRLKSSWWSLQDAVPLLERLQTEAANLTNTNFHVEDATRRATVGLTQIENTIAAAALRKYRAIRPFVMSGQRLIPFKLKVQVRKSWDLLTALIESLLHPTIKDSRCRTIVSRLAVVARNSNHDRLHKELTSAVSRTKEFFYTQRITDKIRTIISEERDAKRASISLQKLEAARKIASTNKKFGASTSSSSREASEVGLRSGKGKSLGSSQTKSTNVKAVLTPSVSATPSQHGQKFRILRRKLLVAGSQCTQQQGVGMEIRIIKEKQCFACVDMDSDDLNFKKEAP